jgi:hypothetical protein
VALPERRVPLLARNAACPLLAREHNEHNVDSASPVPEHFSNEPFFDSRDEATAERLDIFNDRSSARSPARRNRGHQGRPRVKRADVGASILAAMVSKSFVGQRRLLKNASKTRRSDNHGKLPDDRTLAQLGRRISK